MADKKISALTSATTPLAGTEVLPIVQSGTTKQVSVANLTAGRAVSTAGGTFTDNMVQGTAAKGVNFTANTPAAGMTSQLLNWYEDGTWTATLTGSTTAPTVPQTATGNYTRIGRQVTVQVALENKTTIGAVGNIRVTGLPFAASGKFVGSCVAYNFGSVQFQASTANTESQLYFEDIQLNQISISAGVSKYLYLTTTYFV